MKSNVSYFLHKNKVFFVCLMLAVSSLMPCKSYSNEFNKRSDELFSVNNPAIAPLNQDDTNSITAEEWYAKGRIEQKYNKYGESIKSFYKVIELNPNWAEAYFYLGIAYYMCQSRSDSAVKYFNKAIELNPNYTEAYYRLGITYSEYSAYENDSNYIYANKEVECFEKATELDPNYAEVYCSLGAAHIRSNGDSNRAIDCYEKAIELNPDNYRGYEGLAFVYSLLCDIEKEIEYLKKAARLGGSDSQNTLKSKNIKW